jgi:hypothetical protein
MVPVLSLWLPILVSAVLVFVASSLIHMLLKYHANDYAEIPGGEAAAADVLRSVPPGQYTIPYAAGMKEMGEADYLERMARGPVALITLRRPEDASMGRALVSWFLFALAVSIFAAYVAGRTHAPGADYLSVFRFAGTAAFLAHGVGSWPESIWFGRPWKTTFKNTIDGAIYAVLVGGSFGWLWPGT